MEEKTRPPILADKAYGAPSEFLPENLLREARRQKQLPEARVPEVCVLDPDGDIGHHLRRKGAARLSDAWACYHTELYEFDLAGRTLGIIGCAVGAPFAVLVAEQLFASGCRFLISVTSAGQVTPVAVPPYFVVIDRALRDEGTSYHYAAPSEFADADQELADCAVRTIEALDLSVYRGPAGRPMRRFGKPRRPFTRRKLVAFWQWKWKPPRSTHLPPFTNGPRCASPTSPTRWHWLRGISKKATATAVPHHFR